MGKFLRVTYHTSTIYTFFLFAILCLIFKLILYSLYRSFSLIEIPVECMGCNENS